jgi:acetolactate synthase-1/2/3 large subunit
MAFHAPIQPTVTDHARIVQHFLRGAERLQSKFFDSRFIGTDSGTGVSFPSVKKIAGAYGIKYFLAASSSTLETVIREVLAITGPALCEVIVPRDQEVVPTVSSVRRDDGSMVSRPIEDMYPFLSREEFLGNMIVKPLPE